MKKFSIAIISVLVVGFLAVGFIFVSQNQKIKTFNSQLLDKTTTSSHENASPKINFPDPESQKFFSGKIKSITGDTLEINADLVKFKDPSKINADAPIKPDDFENVRKLVKVTLSEKTQFNNVKKEDLKVGDEIVIIADKSPFQTDTLTAVQIVAPKMPI